MAIGLKIILNINDPARTFRDGQCENCYTVSKLTPFYIIHKKHKKLSLAREMKCMAYGKFEASIMSVNPRQSYKVFLSNRATVILPW